MKSLIKNARTSARSSFIRLFQQKQSKNDLQNYVSQLPDVQLKTSEWPSLEESFRDALDIQESGDHGRALTLWADMRSQYPDFTYPYAAYAITQAILGRLAEAEAEIAAAIDKFPEDIGTTVNGIQIALMNSNWDVAEERLKYLLHHFPDAPYTNNHAAALENTITTGRKNHYTEVVERAVAAEVTGDWQSALSIWQILFTESKPSKPVILGLSRCAEAAGIYNLAGDSYAVGVAAYPDDLELRAKFAQLASKQKDWQQAATRWQENLAFCQDMDCYADLAVEAYLKVDMYEAAEALLDSAILKYPQRLDLWIHYASVAEKSGRWPDAVARWDRVLELSPDPFLERLRGEAVWRLDMHSIETNGISGSVPAQLVSDDSIIRLVLNFENLCGKCQLGLVQRHYGAEPLGLFRFAAVSPEKILAQLAENFTSLGDPEHLIVEETDFEYIIKDDRDLYWSHTYIKKAESSRDQVFNQQIKRIRFLKRELIEDLHQGTKIFVCTDAETAISDDTLFALLSAVSEYGDNMILGIRHADSMNPRGSVKRLNSRILVGYINEPGYHKNGVVFDFEAWLELMQKAVAFKVEQKSLTFS